MNNDKNFFNLPPLDSGKEGKNEAKSKIDATVTAIIEALDENNISALREYYHTVNFAPQRLKGLKEQLGNLLNSYQADKVLEKLENWVATKTIQVDEGEDPQERQDAQERLTLILSTEILKTRSNKSFPENEVDYTLQLLPAFARAVLSDIKPEAQRDPESQEQINALRKEYGNELREEFPYAAKSEYHAINTKKFIHELREDYLRELGNMLAMLMYEDFRELLGGNESIEMQDDEFYNVVFTICYTHLVPRLKSLIDIYDHFSYLFIKHKFRESHLRREKQKKQQTKQEKSPDHPESSLHNQQEYSNYSQVFSTISPEIKKTIDTTLEQFQLDPKTKKEYSRRIVRLQNNNKPFKLEDFPNIGPENEGKLFDLMEDLGISLWREKEDFANGDQESKSLEEKTIEKSDPIQESNATPHSEQLLDKNLDIEVLLENILVHLQNLNFKIKNPNQLKKQFETFLKSGDSKDVVLSALSNQTLMNSKTQKTGNIYAIHLNYKYRLLLIKDGNDLIIDSFHSDHDAYEDRITALK